MDSVVLGWGRFEPFFHPPRRSRSSFAQRYTDSTRVLSSSGCSRHPLKLDKAAHVVDQVHQPNLHAGAHHADGAHELAAHAVLLIRKHVFDACADPRARGVGSLLALAKGVVASTAAMNAALVAFRLELGFGLD